MTAAFHVSRPTVVLSHPYESVRLPRSAGTYARPSLLTSRSASQSRDAVIDELLDAFNVHQEPDADGYGSDPSDLASFGLAQRLVELLPFDLADPEVSVDPDGEAVLDWHTAPRWTFSVSVGADSVLRYAGLFDGEEVASRARFDAEAVPHPVVALARKAARGQR